MRGVIKKLMESYERLMKRGEAPDGSVQLTPEEDRQRRFQKQLLERLSTTPSYCSRDDKPFAVDWRWSRRDVSH